MKGRLKEADYPSIASPLNGTSGQMKPPRLVIVFMMGGSTYEEAKAVADLNLQVCHKALKFALLQAELDLSHTDDACFVESVHVIFSSEINPYSVARSGLM